MVDGPSHSTALTYSFPHHPELLICPRCRKTVVWSPRGALQASHEWNWERKPCSSAQLESGCRCCQATSRAACDRRVGRRQRGSPPIFADGGARHHSNVPSRFRALPPRECMPMVLCPIFSSRLDKKKGLENSYGHSLDQAMRSHLMSTARANRAFVRF